MTRKTSKKVSMNGKSMRPIVSLRIKAKSDQVDDAWSRSEDSSSTGKMNSSLIIVMRKMQPKIAKVL